jgi:hypothetical protein
MYRSTLAVYSINLTLRSHSTICNTILDVKHIEENCSNYTHVDVRSTSSLAI